MFFEEYYAHSFYIFHSLRQIFSEILSMMIIKGWQVLMHPNLFIEKKLRWSVKQIICPIELKSWKIDCASHQYSDSSPISGSLME